MKVYLAEIVGTGSGSTPFRTAVSEHISRPDSWSDVDGRADFTSSSGEMFTMVFEPTTEEHAAMVADNRITYIPLENDAGKDLGLNDLVGDIEQTKRVAIKNALENKHIPFDDIQLSDTIKSALKRIIKRYLLRQILGGHDLTENFDTLLSEIPVAKRQNINSVLQSRGFDTSGLTGSLTVKQALKELLAQTNKWLKTNL